MKFKDKYSIETEVGKVKLPPEAYAIGELLEMLIQKIEKVRLNLQ